MEASGLKRPNRTNRPKRDKYDCLCCLWIEPKNGPTGVNCIQYQGEIPIPHSVSRGDTNNYQKGDVNPIDRVESVDIQVGAIYIQLTGNNDTGNFISLQT